MIEKHAYDIEDLIDATEKEFSVRSYKVERCKQCKILKVSFQKHSGEWETLGSNNEPPCNGASY
jgi:hypothetical protein